MTIDREYELASQHHYAGFTKRPCALVEPGPHVGPMDECGGPPGCGDLHHRLIRELPPTKLVEVAWWQAPTPEPITREDWDRYLRDNGWR